MVVCAVVEGECDDGADVDGAVVIDGPDVVVDVVAVVEGPDVVVLVDAPLTLLFTTCTASSFTNKP